MSGHYRFRRSFGNVGSLFRGARPDTYPRFTGFLDTYPGAAAAYSLRALSSDFEDADVISVRETGAQAEEGFTPNEITDGSLLNFTGANDGFVPNWYDQSGNNLTQSNPSTGQQLRIVTAGELTLPDFLYGGNGNHGYLGADTGSPVSGGATVFSVIRQGAYTGATVGGAIWSFTDGAQIANNLVILNRSSNQNNLNVFIKDTSGSSQSLVFNDFFSNFDNVPVLVTVILNASAAVVRFNGTVAVPNSTTGVYNNDLTASNFAIHGYGTASTAARVDNGYIAEAVAYLSDKTDDADAIERNIAKHYGITLPTSIVAVGDSMTRFWPTMMSAALPDRNVLGIGIPGTGSAAQVGTFEGVQVSYPVSGVDTITAGTVTVQFLRYPAKLTFFGDTVDLETYRVDWPERAAKTTTPTKVSVYNNGRKIGEATHDTLTVTTDYGTSATTLTSVGHSLQVGDRVAFWVDDPARPPRNNEYWQSGDKPSAIIEYKVYEVFSVNGDDFEIKETDPDVAALDLGSDASGTLICETGWTFDWEYDGEDWDLTYKVESDLTGRILLIQTTTNDDYAVFDTETVPNIDRILAQQGNNKVVYVTPSLNAGPTDGVGSDNWNHINDTVRPWAEARVSANWKRFDTYDACDAGDVRETEELAMLSSPPTAELLWISGNPHTPATWVANATEQGGDHNRWVGEGFLPLNFRAKNSFSDPGHTDDDDGAQFVADGITDVINNAGW